MTKFEELPSEIQSYFESELNKFNEFIQRLNISKDHSKNSILCINRMIRFLLNRFNGVEIGTEDGIVFYSPEKVYTAEDLISSYQYHEILFKTMDVNEFPKNKWYLIDITENRVSILIRGDTFHESNYLYEKLIDIVKDAKKINWSGTCDIYRSYQYD